MIAGRRLRAVLATMRRRPAPALIVISILGWAVLVFLAASSATHASAGHAGHGMHASHAGHAIDPAAVALQPPGWATWLVMVVAMSPPLLLREVTSILRGSLRRRRALTILVFGCGYLSVWMLAGAVAGPIADQLAGNVAPSWLAVALVGVWLCSPARQRCLNVCHRTRRLRVFGAAAQADAWRYGVLVGAACAASCGPLMLLVLLASDYHLVAMIAATILLTIERYLPVGHPRWRLPFLPSRVPEHVQVPAWVPIPSGSIAMTAIPAGP